MGKASHHVEPIISILILHLYYGGEALTDKWTVFFFCSFSKTIPRSRFSLSFWNQYRAFLTKDLFTMELDGKFYRMYQIENVEKCYIVTLIRKFCLLEILLILWKSINMTNMIITVIILLFHYLSLFLPCKFTRCQQRRPSVISSNSFAQI